MKRSHGGAVKLESAETESGRYSTESIYRNVAQKKQIAEMAYDFLEDRDTIIIDDASTSFYLAREIRNHPEKRIAVVTNSLITGNELAGVGHVELFMIGGYVTGHLAATMGDVAIQNMSKFHVDKAFIGVHSINFNVGLTSHCHATDGSEKSNHESGRESICTCRQQQIRRRLSVCNLSDKRSI